MSEEAKALYEELWNLRNAQSNATSPEERAEIQREIEQLYKQIDQTK